MKNQLNLSQIKRCDQYWDDMEQKEKGRICGKCKKFLYDFRGMSDLEIAYIHSQSDKPVCGMYDDFRLIDNPNFNKTKFKLNKLYVAGVFGLLLNNVGTDNKIKAQTVQTELNLNDKVTTNQNDENDENNEKEKRRILKGVVLDTEGNPLQGVAIFITGNYKGEISDSSGNFEIDVTEEFLKEDIIQVSFTYPGIIKNMFTLEKSNFIDSNIYEIKMNRFSGSSTTYDIGFAPIQSVPWYKKLWRSIVGIFE